METLISQMKQVLNMLDKGKWKKNGNGEGIEGRKDDDGEEKIEGN